MKCLFLYNPNSGRGKIGKKLPVICRRLEKIFSSVEVCAPASKEELIERVRESEGVYDALVFAGGDGTFHDVLQAKPALPLGYLPTGTTNDVARTLKIPRRLKGALKVIADGRTQRIDCLSANGVYVAYVAVAGAFTGVTYLTPQSKKRRLGWLAYVISLRKHFKFSCYRAQIRCGDKQESLCAALIFILNGKYVSSFPVNRRADIADGKLEVVAISGKDKSGFWGRVRICMRIVRFFLFGAKKSGKYIRRYEGDAVEVHAPHAPFWDFDGEKGQSGNIRVHCINRAITLFVPKNKKI